MPTHPHALRKTLAAILVSLFYTLVALPFLLVLTFILCGGLAVILGLAGIHFRPLDLFADKLLFLLKATWGIVLFALVFILWFGMLIAITFAFLLHLLRPGLYIGLAAALAVALLVGGATLAQAQLQWSLALFLPAIVVAILMKAFSNAAEGLISDGLQKCLGKLDEERWGASITIGFAAPALWAATLLLQPMFQDLLPWTWDW